MHKRISFDDGAVETVKLDRKRNGPGSSLIRFVGGTHLQQRRAHHSAPLLHAGRTEQKSTDMCTSMGNQKNNAVFIEGCLHFGTPMEALSFVVVGACNLSLGGGNSPGDW